MASIPRLNSGDQNRAATYRERSAHLRTIADGETDPILREQLRDLASQYDEIAESTAMRRETIDGMRRRFERQLAANSQRRLQGTELAFERRQKLNNS